MIDFVSMFNYLEYTGFFQIVVPFLLIFTILFVLLDKTKLFGSDKDVINAVVSALLASLALVNNRLVEWMELYLGNFVVMVVLLSLTLLLFMFIANIPSTFVKILGSILAIVAVIWALIESQYYSPHGTFTVGISYLVMNLRPYMNMILVIGVFVLPIGLIIASIRRRRNTSATS